MCPETRYIEHYDREGNIIWKEPYELSDEELQAEANDARLKEIAAMGQSAIKVPLLAEGFKLLCKKLGFD